MMSGIELPVALGRQELTVVKSLYQKLNEVSSDQQESQVSASRHTDAAFHLTKRIEELTRELEEARRAALAATIAKGEFLASISYEIRTPLNGIVGMTELLLGTKLSGEQREFVDIAQSSLKTLLAIVNNRLDLFTTDSERLELDHGEFDLNECLEEVADVLTPRAEGRKLSLICFLHPQARVRVCGDLRRLTQVLSHLADNAIKFSNRGEITVRGDLEYESDTTLCLLFRVKDPGIGIPVDAQRSLFQSSSQADPSTGMGLATAKEIVELMGGEMGVKSEPGRGSEFWFTVSLDKPTEPKKLPRSEVDFDGKRVLIVDASRASREVLRIQLESWNCVVEEAESADDAKRFLNQHVSVGVPFEIVLFDLAVAGEDPELFAEGVKVDPELADTQILLLAPGGRRAAADPNSSFDGIVFRPIKEAPLHASFVHALRGDLPERSVSTVRFRVLLAEDNVVNQRVATRMLQSLGCEIEIAENGRKALQMIKVSHFDMIFMDCQMPRLDGFQTTGAIREWEGRSSHPAGETPRIPIIAMTANAMMGDRKKCLDAGMDDYISKPVKRAILEEALSRWGNRPS